ncbi:oxygen-independent coproporphyrinogen III oxidase [Sphingomonas paucimobilis]|uniref:oxygen-independent coproporphyrinogen III oxidase n=1 Tax=Sphingomonas paucimobilis TaxID=13689 RepID=UPI0028D0A82C|nr:oxygen-independent coproporphyrinogen III oxidase [Sphingomonas paucimobilis]
MSRFHPDLAARPVPRYTSYPTAMDFTTAVGAERQALALLGVARETPVSLYVHVPYCREICWYCGCNTGAVGRTQRLDDYVEALLAEIATVAALLDGRISSVHFGGGSPNVLSPIQLLRIADAIRDQFGVAEPAEWAIEIDPRGFGAEHATALATIGITRVSIGAQTFAAPIQRAINRIQPYDLVADVVDRLRLVGISHINLDLMYGLPHQSRADVAASIASALTLRPSRIAMFGYAHLPAMLPRQRMIDAAALPDAEERFHQSELAHERMIAAGYRAIGFDHFARADDRLARADAAGRLRRNFQGFTDDPAQVVVGLGTSAISQFDGVIVQNEKHVGRYRELVKGGRLAGIRGVRREAEDRLRGAIIERILCDGHADLTTICAEHGADPALFVDMPERLVTLAKRGIVHIEGMRLAVADRCYRRIVAASFDARRPSEAARASVAV